VWHTQAAGAGTLQHTDEMERPRQQEQDALLTAAEVGDLAAVKKLLGACVDLVHSSDKVRASPATGCPASLGSTVAGPSRVQQLQLSRSVHGTCMDGVPSGDPLNWQAVVHCGYLEAPGRVHCTAAHVATTRHHVLQSLQRSSVPDV
jgi:hypothetical protein